MKQYKQLGKQVEFRTRSRTTVASYVRFSKNLRLSRHQVPNSQSEELLTGL